MLLRRLLIGIGLVIAAFGLLFVGQGMGVIRWPESSFMIDRSPWVTKGAAIAALGLALVLIGRRVRR
ncbi:hypothetical protein GCM10009106_06330 [Sphingomonas japonica]|nr:hypothetical protein [Sphingomonas japonica]